MAPSCVQDAPPVKIAQSRSEGIPRVSRSSHALDRFGAWEYFWTYLNTAKGRRVGGSRRLPGAVVTSVGDELPTAEAAGRIARRTAGT